MLADVVGGDVGVELADGGEGNVAHGGVAEFSGEDREAGGAGGIVGSRDDLGEDLGAETGYVRCLVAAVGASDDLPADDIEDADGNAALIAHGIVTRVLVQEAGQQPCAEIGAVGLVEEAAPGVGPESADAFAQNGVGVDAFRGQRGDAEEDEGGVVEGLTSGDLEVVLPARRMGTAPPETERKLGMKPRMRLGCWR